MRSDSQFWPRRVAILLAGASLVALGCGGRRGGREIGEIPLSEYDHYFFVGIPKPEVMTADERRQRIANEIERLRTPAWRTARENLFRLGKESVDLLIENIDRTEPTGALVRPVPGPTLPELEQTWPMGYVVYTVLLDFIGNYSNYSGTYLPGFDRKEWRDWWAGNGKGILVYDPDTTAPGYVKDQIARAEAAMSSRYRTIAGNVARQREAEAKRKAEQERARAKKVAAKKAVREVKVERERESRKPAQDREAKAGVSKKARTQEKEAAEKVSDETKKPEAKPEGEPESREEAGKAPSEEEEKPTRRSRRRRKR